jgi:hypothetical protein
MTGRILPLCLALGVVLTVGPPIIAEAEPIKDQRKFSIGEAKPIPGRIPDGGLGIQAYTWRCNDPKNPNADRYTATIAYSYLSQHHKGVKLPVARLTLPPDLANGTIFPLLGYVYRVNFNGGEMLSLEWVPEAKFPAGLKPVKLDSMFVLLDAATDISGTIFLIPDTGHNSRLILRKIDQEKDGAKRLVATLEYRDADNKPLRVEVREGEMLATPQTGGYEVRSIVPADPKAGVLGWVELSSKPMDNAELEKTKRRVVRFPAAR